MLLIYIYYTLLPVSSIGRTAVFGAACFQVRVLNRQERIILVLSKAERPTCAISSVGRASVLHTECHRVGTCIAHIGKGVDGQVAD